MILTKHTNLVGQHVHLKHPILTKKETIKRYHLIIQKLRSFPANFEEILQYLEMQSEIHGYDFNISKRTFQRDLNDIRSLYNIDIQYDKMKRAYYIDFQEEGAYSDRLMEAFDTFNLLNVSEDLTRYVHLEKRQPQGTEHLSVLLKAIKSQNCIEFSYKKFTDEPQSKRRIEPLGLKEYRNRWYVLGKDVEDQQIKNFGFDRLQELVVTKDNFEVDSSFNLSHYYKHSFGVNRPIDKEPIEIVLSFHPYQGKYIKTLPLHHSQKVIIDTDKELRISLFIYPTYDFWIEIQSLGDNVKVLSPQNLKELTNVVEFNN